MAKKIISDISRVEWHYVAISTIFLILPVVSIIPAGFPTWIMGCIVLFLLATWFAFILYLLLFSIKFTMQQDKEMELVKSIEKHFIKVLEDVEWTDDTVNMVIDALYDWTRLPQEEKHKR